MVREQSGLIGAFVLGLAVAMGGPASSETLERAENQMPRQTTSKTAAEGAKAPPASVTAKSVFVMNADNGEILYEKNPDEVFRILSLTKLVTAYVLIDQMGDSLGETVTISRPHLAGGSTAGLRKGDIWRLQDLLYGMVLVSGNDASLAIADAVGRDLLAKDRKRPDTAKATARFVEEMRKAAASLGAGDASFADPYGLSAMNAATARDMGLIAARIFTDKRLLPAWACPARTLQIGGKKPRAVALKTSLEILGEGSVIGAKTGSYNSKKIFNLAAAWRAPNGQTLVGVVLGAPSNKARYDEMRTLMASSPRDFPKLAEAPVGVGAPLGVDAPREAPCN